MDELEQQLSSRRLAAPSAELDRRLERTFAAARGTASQPRPAPVWWLAYATVFASLAVLVVVGLRRPIAAPPPVVYRFEATGRMCELLLNPPANRAAWPHFVIHERTP